MSWRQEGIGQNGQVDTPDSFEVTGSARIPQARSDFAFSEAFYSGIDDEGGEESKMPAYPDTVNTTAAMAVIIRARLASVDIDLLWRGTDGMASRCLGSKAA